MTPPKNEVLEARLRRLVDDGELAGAATITWREGEVVQATMVGSRDQDARLRVERDTLFRIASMTKPITSVAALSMLEEGKFGLDEPIARWAPEFRTSRVLRTPDAPLDDTVGWPGAFGGWWQADPTDNSALVFLAHNIVELDQLSNGIGLGVYQAITDFHSLEAARAPDDPAQSR